MAEYAASKAAATSYTRSVGLAVAGHGIRVNVVSPGSTLTPMLTGMWTSDTDRERVLTGTPEQFRLGIPLGRIADPADIASTAVFLLSDAARHITMHDLRVDGGATLDM
jgi:2,3-dihydro-2,3-dihydroxybenzoate dehydrogenase